MTARILVLFLGIVLTNALEPEVKFEEPNGVRLRIKDDPSLLHVKFEVQVPGRDVQSYVTSFSAAGFWEFFDPELKVKSGDIIDYKVTAFYKDDNVEETNWLKYEIDIGRHIRSMKRASYIAFRDDYSSTFDKSKYKIDCTAWGGGNGEFQVYTPDSNNLYVSGGNLYLKPTQTVDNSRFDSNFLYHGRLDLNSQYHCCTFSGNYGCDRSAVQGHIINPIMSAKVTTNANILYGKVKVRARIPKGDWIWPAIWMLPVSYHYGGWPRSGEIDIMEARGNKHALHGSNEHGLSEVATTLHWGPSSNENRYYKTHGELDKPGGGDWHGFHTYELHWDANHISTYVDGTRITSIPMPGNGFWAFGGFHGNNIWASGGHNAPFDHHFHLILNVAVGGAYFPSSYHYDHSRPWTSNDQWIKMKQFWENRNQWLQTWHGDDVAMLIDYVEMEQY